jgi:hypothetical protein
MSVRRDYRITVALTFFKQRFPCNANGELAEPPAITEPLVEAMCDAVLQRTGSSLQIT